MDTFSKSKRSEIMSKVSGKDTKPEKIVRRYLFINGFRYRKNVKGLPGKPDIVLPKYKTIIFVHGCFWHGHSNCEASRLPASNIEYWTKKISSNIKRDSQNKRILRKSEFKTIVIWEFELKKEIKKKRLNSIIKQLYKRI
jgi:DNA mismatch endonuclease (patch repair protein)